ncbi:MAG: VIT1/CCC1 transporter family protein [Gammaproteobacteria bacterium]|nr:VIT1/CCC1 transporter family protein [Gammaproteobacteria bacterium]
MDRKTRVRICGASIFISLLVFFILGFYLQDRGVRYAYLWSALSFGLVPILPFVLGLERIRIFFPAVVLIIYLVLGFTINGWNPWWALFFLIPIYYIIWPNDPLAKIGFGYKYRD